MNHSFLPSIHDATLPVAQYGGAVIQDFAIQVNCPACFIGGIDLEGYLDGRPHLLG